VLTAAPAPLWAAEPEVVAQSAIVIDAGTGAVLYQKRADEPWAPASLTKIVTAMVALESAPLDQPLTVEPYDLVGEASMGLDAGEELTLETALYGMLLASGNDAAMTIARNLGALPGDSPQESVDRFMRRANLMLERMGIHQTRLLNPHGLDQPGHRSTARDLALITQQALRNPAFRQIIGSPMYQDARYALQQSNRLLGSYPGLIGGKTGITERCGYCLMQVAERDGHTIVVVLLGSTVQAWYQDAQLLLDYGFEQAGKEAAASSPWQATSASSSRPEDAGVAVTRPQPSATLADVQKHPPVAGHGIARAAERLDVQREAPDIAVVRPATNPAAGHRDGWLWPVSALVAMGAAVALVTTYPAVLGLGSLLWQRHRAASRRAIERRRRHWDDPVASTRWLTARHTIRQRRPHPMTPGSLHPRRFPEAHASRPRHNWGRTPPPLTAGTAEALPPRVVRFDAAEAITSRAIKLARRGDYHAAESEFLRALQVDLGYDFTRCPGFWSLPPAGYVIAARAYRAVGRKRDARTLLTVVRLSFGSTPLLEAELARASALVDPALVRLAPSDSDPIVRRR
jgi:D-alanyl-D-alanine carboxypeptidase (penicillin-binding protein 5/6)